MYPIKLQKTGMLTIQKVTVADCELINKMAGEVFPATYKEILSPEQLDYMMDWMYAPENIRKQMEERGKALWLRFCAATGKRYFPPPKDLCPPSFSR